MMFVEDSWFSVCVVLLWLVKLVICNSMLFSICCGRLVSVVGCVGVVVIGIGVWGVVVGNVVMFIGVLLVGVVWVVVGLLVVMCMLLLCI